MPQLPSGLKVYLSSLAVVDFQGRKDWFRCPEGHFWYLTPNLSVSPPPYRPQDEITLDFQSAPVPENRDEAMHFVHVLLEDPEFGIYWRGDWLPDFHETHPLSNEDRNFWLGWIGQNDDFLDHLISSAREQSVAIRNVTGEYKNIPRESMIGMRMPAWCLGKEVVEERVFFYPLSQLLAKSHRLPSSVQQLDYETAVNIVGQALHEQGCRIIHADRDYETDLSLLAESKIGTIAIKVTTRRAPMEPTFTKDEAARLKRLPRAQRYFMAPVGLMPVAERSADGHLGFHAKYEGLVEI